MDCLLLQAMFITDHLVAGSQLRRSKLAVISNHPYMLALDVYFEAYSTFDVMTL